jgi:hypothetical protein
MPRTLITRVACAVAVPLLICVSLTTQSTTAAPLGPPAPPDAAIDFPGPDFPEVCAGFVLRLEIWGAPNRVVREFKDGRILRAGRGNALAFTNLSNNERIFLTTGGSVENFTLNPDGSTTFVGTGHNVILLFPTDVLGPSTTLYVGRVVFTVDPTGVFALQSFVGTSTDICAALS